MVGILENHMNICVREEGVMGHGDELVIHARIDVDPDFACGSKM